MARQIGLLGRAQLEQEVDQARARAAKLRILHTIGTAIASALDLEQVLTRIVEAAVYIAQAEVGSLLVLDEGTQELYLRAQKGMGEKHARGFRMRVQDSIAGEVLQSGRPQRLANEDQQFKVVTGYLVNSILYVPVVLKDRSIGVLAVDNQMTGHPFSEDDENMLMVLAGYAAIALENARLMAEAGQRFQALATLHGASQVESDQPLGDEVLGVLLGCGDTRTPFQPLTPEYLATVIGPCLDAVARVQQVLDKLAGRSPVEVRVLAITQGWPVPVSLQGAREAIGVVEQMVLPLKQSPEEGEAGTAAGLALDLLDQLGPDLSERIRLEYATQLLPALEVLLTSPLQCSQVEVPAGSEALE